MKLVPLEFDISALGRPFAFEHCYPSDESAREIFTISPEGIVCCDGAHGNWRLRLQWDDEGKTYRLENGAPLGVSIDVDAVMKEMDLVERHLIALVRLIQLMAFASADRRNQST